MDANAIREGKRRQTAVDDDRGPTSPSASSSSSSRKRHAPFEDEELAEHSSRQLRINTANTLGLDDLCTCGLEPKAREVKIPRPRNAFILYRQHHQSQVTAENPKLSNPDISKIIGQKWKEEGTDVKETWKSLAEEEKQRHQIQYPDYRYQPRRAGRGSNKGVPSPTDSERCAKCNGRIPVTFRTPTSVPSTPSSSRPDFERSVTPSQGRYGPEVARRHSVPFSGQLPPVRSADDEDIVSPEMKRRRANDMGQYHPMSSASPGYSSRESQYMGRTPGEYMPDGGIYGATQQMSRFPLPGPRTPMRVSVGGAMGPPPRPSPGAGWAEQGRRLAYEDSVRLPPLQSSVPPSPRRPSIDGRYMQTPSTSASGVSYAQTAAPKTFEAQVMALPYIRKLEVLARVCQAVPVASGADRPRIEARGAFIAVESSNAEMLAGVGRVVERGLALMPDLAPKIWTTDSKTIAMLNGVETVSNTGSKSPPPSGELSTSDFFPAILAWHNNSKQIETYITHRDGESQTTEGRGGNEASTEKAREKLRVALARDGYSLTMSDRFANSTKFRDTYSPVDHWQWMASMWRGTVCPDLIIYAKPATEEEIGRYGTVEFFKSMGMIVVRGLWRENVDEATERRLMFELNEWIREGSFREEKPSNWRRTEGGGGG